MGKKESIKNKTFNTVKEKLEYIQKNCPETELFEDLAQLFKNKKFRNVKITHGNKEYGKDLVFSRFDDSFEEEKWYAAIVKNKSATQNDFIPGNEIANQIETALKKQFKDSKGELKRVSGLFIIINGKVTDNASDLIGDFVSPVVLPNIKIFDYQLLKEQIENHSKDSFLANLEPSLDLFIKEQTKSLSDVSSTNKMFDLQFTNMNDIFVNVQTTYSRELKKMNKYVAFEKGDKKYIEEDIEGSNEVLNSNKNFIIHGIPTSGKSLFLKRVGIKALSASNPKPNAVFYFDLQNHEGEILNIDILISDQYRKLTSDEEFNFENYNKIILLFDSIDFIKTDEKKKDIYKAISQFVSTNYELMKLQVLIATRDLDFVKSQDGFSNFEDTELLPFNIGQALQLVKKIIPNNKKKANNFLQALKNSMLNTTLQRTPLALTLLAILYRDDKVDLNELPANIFALYDRFTDVYLDKWDNSKGITSLYKYEQTKNILAFIAYELHDLGLSTISTEELIIFLRKLRTEYNYDELNNIKEFVDHLKSQNGVFSYNPSNDNFQFFNHYFQEYFASLCIEDEDSSILIKNFYSSWWSNSIVFYCGKKSKSFHLHEQIIKEIIPISPPQKFHYIHQHSKCLQASHAISISNRTKAVKKMLFEYDNFFKSLLEEGQKNDNAAINGIPFVSVLNQSKMIFESLFSSKHVSTTETIELFEDLLFSDNSFCQITNYNLAYFLAFLKNIAVPFEVFEEKVKDELVWSRILYVDINFLNLKKKINDKKYIRIRRKMRKNKFRIQHLLRGNITNLGD